MIFSIIKALRACTLYCSLSHKLGSTSIFQKDSFTLRHGFYMLAQSISQLICAHYIHISGSVGALNGGTIH